MPGTPAWRARIASIVTSPETHVLIAFWLFGELPHYRLFLSPDRAASS